LNVHGIKGKNQHHTGSHEGAAVQGGTPDVDGRGGECEDRQPDTDSEFGHDAYTCEEEGHETRVVVGVGLLDAVAGTVVVCRLRGGGREERSVSVGVGTHRKDKCAEMNGKTTFKAVPQAYRKDR